MVDRHSGRIVLHGPQASVRRALELARELDVPILTYQVEIRVASESERKARGIELAGELALAELGLVSSGSDTGEGLELHAGAAETRDRGSFSASLAVTDGEPAALWTGLVRSAAAHGVVLHSDQRSGMRLETRTLQGGQVKLTIQPVRSGTSRAAPIAAATRLQLEPGTWVALGEVSTRRSGSAREIPAAGSTAASETQRLFVRATPLSSPALDRPPSAAE